MTLALDVTCRKASTDDTADLVELRIQQLIDEGYPEERDIRSELREYFLNGLADKSLRCWLGTLNGSIIATAGLCFIQLPPSFANPSGRIAYLTNMYTKPEHRGNGIASQLVDVALAEAKALGYTRAKLHASNQGAGIYRKAGFFEVDGYMMMKLD